MAKIKFIATVSSEFDIDPDTLDELDVIDSQLAVDTNLFIDPLLLPLSKHEEMNVGAATAYEQRFEFIVKLLAASKAQGDVAWRKAEKLFSFSEVSWTCLGYSSSVRGAGFGPELSAATLKTASEIVKLGITDIDFFMGLSLLEEGIGPDRISDMTTNIIIMNLIDFTVRVNSTLNIPVKRFVVDGKGFDLPLNPYSNEPLVLVPRDIVRDLPIATDWSDIARVSKENQEYREKVSGGIGKIWSTMTKKRKSELKESALKSKEAFEQVLELLHEVPKIPYDFAADTNGENFWIKLASIAREYPIAGGLQNNPSTIEEAKALVGKIVSQFQDLIENKGIWKELWSDNERPRKEKAAQRLFFSIAYSYCKANNLDITPEADSGNGPVDFKFSKGFDVRIVVEIKLSTNTSLVRGYTSQLEIYKKAEDTVEGVYLVIDVGQLGNKYGDIQRIRREAIELGEQTSAIYLVDGNRRESASKR
ncbi:hypothetical protein GNE00_12540 [Pseudomonas sp. JL972]|uniref:hypothetical protein n=1 Tax=Stutzerimonas degradans TaxID=2968968 RepID=UPI0012D935A9|nr:hypothetical protein [Stutzerimonas degradans]MTZ14578.1 hypothetical protein [Stutzerimonas degradans]